METVDARAGKGRAIREARGAADETDENDQDGARIGRYHLLELVGTGGMGMVWGAWDPQLERRVALKLVRVMSEGSHERMLREGQVLAKLSHPNLVPIFDVGVMGGQVYLVMEWIRGVTLREYGATATPRALLAAYRQAGEGLAAAHHAGVVHRDFKPDNAIRGEDGRVRVLDFGLAHSDGASADSPGAGTPRYMPPEQARGLAATAASDQYAFCVSLREALEGAGGVPGWIETIADRGTAEDPAQRFASMDELLAALARDPARRWRRGAFAVVALGAATGSFAYGRTHSTAIEACSGGDAELATSWSPMVRGRVTEHLRSLGPAAAAEGLRIAAELDDYAKIWTTESRRVCLANERREVTPAIHEGRIGCLARTRLQLGAAGELMATVNIGGLAQALVAASSLPDSRTCVDDPGSVLPPPAAMAERVKALAPRVERVLVRAAAKLPEAIPEATAISADARATGYAPLVARALLAEGRARNDEAERRALFFEAMRLALRGFDEILAVEAYARWIFTGVIGDLASTDNWEVMVEIAERSGRPGRFARALMYSHRGLLSLRAEDRAGARAMFEHAQQAAGDAEDVELASIAQNLAQLEADPAIALRQLRNARDRFAAALGPAHPLTHIAAVQVAMVTADRAMASAEIEGAYRSYERWQKPNAYFAWQAAWLADESGDRASASAWMARIPDDASAISSIARAYLALEAGTNTAEHVANLEQLVKSLDQTTVWNRTYAADALVLVARSAPQAWERVLAVLEINPLVIYSRRLARARRMVAEQWAETRPDDARRLAEQALLWYRGAPGDAVIVARLEKIASRRAR